MDIRKVKKLIEMMADSDIGEIEIKEGEDSVRISRSKVQNPNQLSTQFVLSDRGYSPNDETFVDDTGQKRLSPRNVRRTSTAARRAKRPASMDTFVAQGSQSPRRSSASRTGFEPTQLDEGPDQAIVTAPMVGTFYLAPDPDSDAFVQVGEQVKEGDTLCIIESMKMMNRITAEIDGILEKVLVENSSGVEYDQPLFVLGTAS